MKITRKNFLRLAGGAAFAAGACKLVERLGSESGSAANALAATTGSTSKPVKRWGMAIDSSKSAGKVATTASAPVALRITFRKCRIPRRKSSGFGRSRTRRFSHISESTTQNQNWRKSLLLILCNHCADPPCVRVCPTQATWKREDGIVMMDYHRCIGCRYCMAGCPVRFSQLQLGRSSALHSMTINSQFPTRTKGVVEKCNFCEERLADGLLPACVEACAQKALIFGNLTTSNSVGKEGLSARTMSCSANPNLGTGPSVFYLV